MLSSRAIGVLFFAIAAAVAVSQSSCTYGRNIHFVLPDGYAGRFEVVLDEVNGIDVKFEDGRYTYEIPESGILKVKSFEPFNDWHRKTAAYRNGTVIPDEDQVNSEIPALRSLSGSGSRSVGGKNVGPVILGYAIGTEDEARKAMTTTLTPR
jgi:hypothetical protein